MPNGSQPYFFLKLVCIEEILGRKNGLYGGFSVLRIPSWIKTVHGLDSPSFFLLEKAP